MAGGERKVTLHPAALQRALDAEAEAWACETDVVDSWLGRMSSDPRTVAKLRQIAVLAFIEGLYRGACNAIDGTELAFAVDDVLARNQQVATPPATAGEG